MWFVFSTLINFFCASLRSVTIILGKSRNAMDPALSIPAFYSRRSVFITGATGFLGKALIEKLLRSCPDIGELFLLIRAKKSTSAKERLCQLLTNPVISLSVISNLAKVILITYNIKFVCFSYLIYCGKSNHIASTN